MSSFVGLPRRAKNIVRWNLMSQFQPENVAVHSYEVSIISHLPGVIGKTV
jgi:5'-deoxynucleotidase YfbR-like HD superfamily hydrolase|tara:strand:+ start:3331 stop:3480 length:150 start_codon:yes stop_codon:yes gene_type:complete